MKTNLPGHVRNLGQWRLIDEAPADSTPILAYPLQGSWTGGITIIAANVARLHHCKIWMPLPPIPKEI